MDANKKHFSDLYKYLEFLGFPKPENSMFTIVSFENKNENSLECKNQSYFFSSDFYSISLKDIISGDIFYGRTKYDCQSGTMIFTAPNQDIKIENLNIESYGKTIIFHKDFIRKTPLNNEIEQYNFFNYSINESLHLSEREKIIIETLFSQIELEYHNNQDEFSEEIIIEHLSTLLKYSNRFYHRQFLHRKKELTTTEESFYNILRDHYNQDNQHRVIKLPKIKDIADKLCMTPRYLSDKLKVETGKTAIEILHLFLIDKAKDLLINKDKNVSSVAFELGFDYQQHFSKLFKKNVGISPKEYAKKLEK